MKLPEDVRQLLDKCFQNRRPEWLEAEAAGDEIRNTLWPLEIKLGIPTEALALKQPEGVRTWLHAWQNWAGTGMLLWEDRQWKSIGKQRVPARLILSNPLEVTLWIGQSQRWQRAVVHYKAFIERWPMLKKCLTKNFNILADYNDADLLHLQETLAWLNTNPNSNLYPRQLPIIGIDSKWIDSRKKLLSDLMAAIQGDLCSEGNFFQRCGLKVLSPLIRLRILDQRLRDRLGRLGDITSPLEQVATLELPAKNIFIVENLQTGLAFTDLADTIVIMGLGYGVDVLSRLPWLVEARCIYWGDLDTHGFAILNRARNYLPKIQSVLMNEETLMAHQSLWVEEKEPHPAEALPLLTTTEQVLYQSIKQNRWRQNIRLEQERIHWDFAWRVIIKTLKDRTD